MELIKKVPAIYVKKCFVGTRYINKHHVTQRYLPQLTAAEFARKLNMAKKYAEKLSENGINRIISQENKKRLIAFDGGTWYLAVASLDELGVWFGAGGLPREWTNRSLRHTIACVSSAVSAEGKGISARAKRALPGILKHINIIKEDPFLYPIVLTGGTMGRRKCQLMAGDINDGCMRSIALGLSGETHLNIYFNQI